MFLSCDGAGFQAHWQTVANSVVGMSVFLRKSFLTTAVPVRLTGIGGPGAPHVFHLERRANLGFKACS